MHTTIPLTQWILGGRDVCLAVAYIVTFGLSWKHYLLLSGYLQLMGAGAQTWRSKVLVGIRTLQRTCVTIPLMILVAACFGFRLPTWLLIVGAFYLLNVWIGIFCAARESNRWRQSLEMQGISTHAVVAASRFAAMVIHPFALRLLILTLVTFVLAYGTRFEISKLGGGPWAFLSALYLVLWLGQALRRYSFTPNLAGYSRARWISGASLVLVALLVVCYWKFIRFQ